MADTVIIVGIIGFGLSGRYFHASFLSVHPGFHLKKVVYRRPEEVARFDSLIETVSSVEELLADESIELVFICSPNETHFHYAQAALQHRKHVVVEKPFAISEEETNQLLDLADSNGLVAMAYYNRRWDADFLTLKDLLAKGTLGEIVEYEARYDRFSPVDERNQSWKEQAGDGHGNLFNLGPHLIDQALQLFGIPQTVVADLRLIRPNSKVYDCFTLHLGYSDKLVVLKSSLMVYQNHLRFTLHGTTGSFSKGGLDTQEELLRQNLLPTLPNWGEESAENRGVLYTDGRVQPIESLPGNYRAFYDQLYDTLVNGAEPLVKPHEIQLTARVIALALQSQKEGRILPF